ncbi:ephrin-A4-like [Clavelina lepadiformis]|uniref:ephrin-A4-like n=1 Tax=Clavelina lepadiformis TaxID=159417 RepID=UPI00404326AD
MYRVMFLACAVTVVVSSCAERHVIYWNSQMTPQLLSTVKCTFPVRIGEFMDILCPQKSLMGILYDAREPEIFDLYNVTEEDFNNCNHKGKKDFIFACERPEQENKLTIKFQLVSPSPFGFKFQYCKDYYFVASPRVKDLKPGCHENVSTRLHISVACEPERGNRSKMTISGTKSDTQNDKSPMILNIVQPSKQLGAAELPDKLQTDKGNGNKNQSNRYHAKWPLRIVLLLIGLSMSLFQ